MSTEPSDLEDHSSVTTSDRDSCHDLAALDARKDRSYRIALELLHTERTYVKVLHLIDQVLYIPDPCKSMNIMCYA